MWQLLREEPSEAQVAPQAVSVELQPVEPTTVEDSSRFVGQLEAQEGIVLLAETQGRVTQIFVSSGEEVSAGDPIAQLSPDRSEAEYRSAIAQVRSAEAARANALAELEVAQADQISAEAEVALQREEIDRDRALVEAGALAEQELDITRRNFVSAEADLRAAARRISAARALLAQADADISAAEADAAAIQEDLEDTLVVAPIDGQVGEMSMKLGDYVTTDTPLTTIVQNGTLDLEMAIPVERRSELRLGLPVELLGTQEDQVVTTGNLSFVAPRARENSQLVQAEASFDNPGGQLQDAQRVRARIIWSESSGILIPTDAISRIGGNTFVFVAVPGDEVEGSPDGGESGQEAEGRQNDQSAGQSGDQSQGEPPALVAKQRQVELGDIQDNQYQVLSGLEAGEELVVSGILNLSDGAAITESGDVEGGHSQGREDSDN
ncbi:MAG: efflux RND transporter periplasmic adaptor subunit [Cyanobacteria bacterium P01_A01_bin.135]